MAGMDHLFCAKQLGHSVEILLRTCSKWLDGAQNDREMQLLETALSSPVLPQATKSDTEVSDLNSVSMGLMEVNIR